MLHKAFGSDNEGDVYIRMVDSDAYMYYYSIDSALTPCYVEVIAS